jgi:hypothetical protein
VALVGGGVILNPVKFPLRTTVFYFWDELPEFKRAVLKLCASRWRKKVTVHGPKWHWIFLPALCSSLL